MKYSDSDMDVMASVYILCVAMVAMFLKNFVSKGGILMQATIRIYTD